MGANAELCEFLKIYDDLSDFIIRAREVGVGMPLLDGLLQWLVDESERFTEEAASEPIRFHHFAYWEDSEISGTIRTEPSDYADISEIQDAHNELSDLILRAEQAGLELPFAQDVLHLLSDEALSLMDEFGEECFNYGSEDAGVVGGDDALVETTEQFDFELLPPGKRTIEGVIKHYQRQMRVNAAWRQSGLAIDLGRLRAIRSLGPTDCYVGKKMWLGYVVFTFAGASRVVLECPLQGNATYILGRNWKRLLGKSKQDLRQHHRRSIAKIVHKGDWLARIEDRLRRQPTAYLANA